MGDLAGKVAKNLLKIVGGVVAGVGLGFAHHKVREANTRDKAMKAALRENNGEDEKK